MALNRGRRRQGPAGLTGRRFFGRGAPSDRRSLPGAGGASEARVPRDAVRSESHVARAKDGQAAVAMPRWRPGLLGGRCRAAAGRRNGWTPAFGQARYFGRKAVLGGRFGRASSEVRASGQGESPVRPMLPGVRGLTGSWGVRRTLAVQCIGARPMHLTPSLRGRCLARKRAARNDILCVARNFPEMLY